MTKIDGKSKVKTIIIIAIMVLVGVLGVLGISTAKTYLSGATAGVEPKGVSVAVQSRQATITWTSEKSSMGVIEYGTSPASLLLRSPETESNTNHMLILSPLKPGLSYYFRLRVGDEVFDNNGIPYSFKTKTDESSVTGQTDQNNALPQITNVPEIKPTGDSVCQFGVDYNGDGVKNAFDMAYCKKNGGVGSTSEETTSQIGECKTDQDYDNNGVVNSFDMVKCLQNKSE